MTEEDWNLVLYNAVAATSLWSFLFFVLVILVGKHVLLNIMVGIVVKGFQTKVRLPLLYKRVMFYQLLNTTASVSLRHTLSCQTLFVSAWSRRRSKLFSTRPDTGERP